MRIIDCIQGSEEWERWRLRPTASCFDKFITPARGDYSSQSTAYACEIVAGRWGLKSADSVPSQWMEWGNDFEDSAVLAYEKQFGVKATKAGFVLPDYTDSYGGSPDRLINVTKRDELRSDCEGVLEIKCVKAETLMLMKLKGGAELYAKPQVQGLLMITGAQWCDLYVWHPGLEPLHERVLPDEEYQTKIAEHLLTFLEELKQVENDTRRMAHELVPPPEAPSELDWSKS